QLAAGKRVSLAERAQHRPDRRLAAAAVGDLDRVAEERSGLSEVHQVVGRVQQAAGLRVPAVRLRLLNCTQLVEQARTLVLGRDAEIGRTAEDDPPDDRRCRRMAAVRLTEGLDDERRNTGGERGRLARAAEALETDRAAADRVRTVGVG